MKFIKYLILTGLFFFIIYISGSFKKSEKEIEHECLTEAIQKVEGCDSIKWIVILPGLGCNGCIQEGEAFMKENIENREIFFVLTNISSLKILEQKINLKTKEYQNIFIDRENWFNIPTDNSIYPCIIRIKDKKLVNYEFQCPKNGQAFRKLKNHISS